MKMLIKGLTTTLILLFFSSIQAADKNACIDAKYNIDDAKQKVSLVNINKDIDKVVLNIGTNVELNNIAMELGLHCIYYYGTNRGLKAALDDLELPYIYEKMLVFLKSESLPRLKAKAKFFIPKARTLALFDF